MTQLPLPDYDISDLIAARQWHTLRRWFAALNPSDTAELFSEVSLEEEGLAFRLLSPARTVQVFSYLPPDHQERLIRELPDQQLRHIVNAMTDDDRTRLIEEMPTSVTLKVLAALSPDELRSARELLGYPEDTAGRYMTPDYVSLRPEMTARQALEHIRRVGRGKETLNVLYIVDEHGGLVEDLRLGSLVLADPERSILVIQDPPLVSVRATDDREEVLQLFEKYDRVALPVTDPAGKMLGIITVDDILDVAQQEATEDIQKLGGSAVLDAPYLKVSVWEMIRKRAGWLAVLFIGEMLTATAMGFFQGEIARAVVLTLFIPLIISSGGNSGSQATTLIIRSLALRELKLRDWFRVFRREILSGLALGSLLGVIGFTRVIAWQVLHVTDYGPHFLLVALTVMASLVGVVTFGTTAGSMLPFVLRKWGLDPATASAPFVATLVDVSGLCIYFGVAFFILRGTLL